ncbi:MAG: peptidoglycan-binding protein LysM, partial [Altibacter sp.]|nr:peptidoglycan-binding protein LysM [Altibacter sp.]
ESGLIAAAHLGGAGNVMKFLESNGEDVFADANNVPITRYMKEFAHYDLTSILPDNNAKATL